MSIENENKRAIIEEMRLEGLKDEQIQRFLNLYTTVDLYLHGLEREKDLMTVEEVSKFLIAKLGEEKEKFNHSKVLRLINSGELEAEPKRSNKEGFRVHKSEVEKFVKFRKITLEEWRERALKAENKVENLEIKLKMLEGKLKHQGSEL